MRIPGLAALPLIVIALVFAQASSAPSAAAGPDIQGNVNCDAAINAVDALQVLRYSAGLSTNAPCMAAAGNTNCDAGINAVDALRILRHAAGLTNSAPAGCTAIGDPLGGGPSSVELIEEARANGEITQEQALLYTTFAVFGDSRMPGQFAGENAAVGDTLILPRLSAVFDSLSPETQAAVAPFLLPPSAPGSWLELPTIETAATGAQLSTAAVTWQVFPAVGGKVKVWAQDRYPGDAQKAAGIAQGMETIYASLAGLMQREPISDGGLPDNGGDGALDIYLVHIQNGGEMQAYEGACKKGPGFMLVNSTLPLGSETSPGMLQIAAHEFFHVLEWAFQPVGCWLDEYNWAVEGFAEWAMDYVYPQAQSEHPFANKIFLHPEVSLDADGMHAYGTYLFPFYLSRKAGSPGLVRQIWEAFEADANSLHAIGGVLTGLGGWDAVWPDVALYNWNRPPVDDYKTLDGLQEGALAEFGSIDLGAGDEAVLGGTINHLAARYYHIKFLDAGGYGRFKRNELGAFPHLNVRALTKIGGQWQPPEDWTHDNQKTFCRDLPGQHLEELVIIISNSDGDTELDVNTGTNAPIIEAGATDCKAYEGSATAEINFIGRIFSTEVSGLRFETSTDPAQRYLIFHLTDSPPVTVHASGVDDSGCTISGEMELLPADGTTSQGRVNGFIEVDQLENDHYASIGGWNPDAKYTVTCPGSVPGELGFGVFPILDTGAVRHPNLPGGVLEGEYSESSTFTQSHWTWRFTPAP